MNAPEPDRTSPGSEAQSALEARLTAATVAAFDLGIVYLGHRLGYFHGLSELGNANSGELATAAGADPRYTREWLEAAACSAIIDVYEQSASSDARRYALIPGSENLLTDESGALPALHDLRCVLAAISQAGNLVTHYRDGTGMSFSADGDDMRIGQALATKQSYLVALPTSWLPALGDLHNRLRDQPGGRIADIGIGAGWSSIALARAYPLATVDGLDLDPASVDLARANAAAEGMFGGVNFQVQDAADPTLAGRYDLVCAFECLHDLTRPVRVLRAMRALLGSGGAVLIGDIASPDLFSAPGADSDRITYGYSLFHCLPVGLDDDNAVGTGAVMRTATVRSYAAAAGFTGFAVLPIDHPGWRFYRLTG